jgi:large subunit ribosomal protein L25
MSTPALRAVLKFRQKELTSLPKFIRRNGPLPVATSGVPSTSQFQLPNPFLPFRNQFTNKWVGAKISRRRQAELIKKAKLSNTLHLLPPGPRLRDPVAAALAIAEGTSGKRRRITYAKPLTAGTKSTPGQGPKTAHNTRPSGSQSKASEREPPVASLKAKNAKPPSNASRRIRVVLRRRKRQDKLTIPRKILSAKVHWFAQVQLKEKKGTRYGIRLYAGKRKMFKGHKWERIMGRVKKYRKILLRDMDSRVFRHKIVSFLLNFCNTAVSHFPLKRYLIKKPDPLGKVSRTSRGRLPF